MDGSLVLGGVLTVASFFLLWKKIQSLANQSTTGGSDSDASVSDPGLFRKHSTLKSYTVAGLTYPSIRTFYHPHPQADKLPSKPIPLPLLVFIHGLGGSAAQFAPLLTSLINAAACLAIDLPGCGLSKFEPKNSKAYTTEALARLVGEAIEQHRDAENGQKVILVSHSMGCSLAALLVSSTSPLANDISKDVVGLVAICPRAEPPSETEASRVNLLLRFVPLPVFDLYRKYDKRGGVDSPSVSRYVGKDADAETKRLQLHFNEQSKSDVFFKMVSGMMPRYNNGKPVGGLPGQVVWSGVDVPIFLIAGEQDHVCPPKHIELIAAWLGHHGKRSSNEPSEQTLLPVAAGELPRTSSREDDVHLRSSIDSAIETKKQENIITDTRSPNGVPLPSADSKPAFVLKQTCFPSPASHSLLYATATTRVLSGLLQSFMATHIDHRLSLGWQLQHLTTEGKWDVKNLAKWQAVNPVSEPIAGIFRAMKTLREVDETHTPRTFVKTWGAKNGSEKGVRMVVDISHESPVYDPKGLEEGGVEYHKFPTVSKLPPTREEVRAFVALVDALREQLTKEEHGKNAVVGVHCHYGFNRTGFFMVSYMVERMGYRLQDAIDEFAEKRRPGIRHEHFINELFVRYAVGLQRRPTLY